MTADRQIKERFHTRAPYPIALFGWLLFVGAGGCLHAHPLPSKTQSTPTCRPIALQKVTGWLDRFEGDCAIFVQGEDKVIDIDRFVLPAGTREGDYFYKGKPDPKKRAQMLREVRALIARHRTPLPKVLSLETPHHHNAPKTQRRSKKRPEAQNDLTQAKDRRGTSYHKEKK